MVAQDPFQEKVDSMVGLPDFFIDGSVLLCGLSVVGLESFYIHF